MGVVMSDLIEISSRDLVTVEHGAGLAIINAELSHFAQALAVAERCKNFMKRAGNVYLGHVDVRFLDHARDVHACMLCEMAAVRAALGKLWDIGSMFEPISYETAVAMLHNLFDVLSKKKPDGESAATLLNACADMFNPANDAIATSTELWEPVSKHPLVLALAIKHLIATSVFAPAPSELREAMTKAKYRLGVLTRYCEETYEIVEHADEIVFTLDRQAWDAAYARVSAEVAIVMRDMLNDESPWHDDDGNWIAPSMRWAVLNGLVQAKTKMLRAAE
jgi:hypothetical protein